MVTQPQQQTMQQSPDEPVPTMGRIDEITPKSVVPVERTEQKKPSLTWQDNPNKCNLKTQYVRKDDLTCIDKPTQPTTTTRVSTSCEQWRPLVEQYSWDVDVALAVMQAESGCNPAAANHADNHGTCIGSFGLMQLACFWTDNPHDPATNVAKAAEIYARSGWQPWGAYTNGAYLRYLR